MGKCTAIASEVQGFPNHLASFPNLWKSMTLTPPCWVCWGLILIHPEFYAAMIPPTLKKRLHTTIVVPQGPYPSANRLLLVEFLILRTPFFISCFQSCVETQLKDDNLHPSEQEIFSLLSVSKQFV